MTYLILGYDFECREFQYQGRTVKGLAFEVKTNEKISERNKHNIAVELSKKKVAVTLHYQERYVKKP